MHYLSRHPSLNPAFRRSVLPLPFWLRRRLPGPSCLIIPAILPLPCPAKARAALASSEMRAPP
eukprot:9200175-Pyramimonas_sp.AAC.1